MGVQFHQVLGLERANAATATVANTPQVLKTTFTITLEVRAHRVGIDQQNFRHRLGRPASRQQHHSLDAIGLAFVSGAAVCLTQVGELVR